VRSKVAPLCAGTRLSGGRAIILFLLGEVCPRQASEGVCLSQKVVLRFRRADVSTEGRARTTTLALQISSMLARPYGDWMKGPESRRHGRNAHHGMVTLTDEVKDESEACGICDHVRAHDQQDCM
jgi:hypothetical protein